MSAHSAEVGPRNPWTAARCHSCTRYLTGFNPSKWQILHIARGKGKTKYYNLCNEVLTTVSHAKYLSLTFLNDIIWYRHVCNVAKKTNSTLHLISRNIRSCPRATRIMANTTLVRLKLEYSSSVWNPHIKEDVNILERVNRRAARLVYNKYWETARRQPHISSLITQLAAAQERKEETKVPSHAVQDH